MAKIKLRRQPPHIDMTPMVDLFFLLLTFFMLTTSFRPQEATAIDTPASISEKPIPDKNVMTILVGKNNKIYFNVDNGPDSSTKFRSKILEEIGKHYSIQFTKEETERFSRLASFGLPISAMKGWINQGTAAERDNLQKELAKADKDGIPVDSLDNQLEMWILYTRQINPEVQAAIKGDGDADYKVVKKVLDILQAKNVNRFNLITMLEKVEVKPEK